MNEKVKDLQKYLKTKGFAVAETSIVDMAVDLARRLGADDWTFACEAKARKEKKAEEENRKEDKMKKEKKELTFAEIPVHIRGRVYTDIGHASGCWEHPDRSGAFQTTEAEKIALALCGFILDQINEVKK